MFIAVDGDSIGKKLESFIFSHQLEKLLIFSQTLNNCIIDISSYIEKNGGTVYMCGGDNILAQIDKSKVKQIIDFVSNIISDIDCEFSIGIGKDSLEAYMALKFAKLSSKNKRILLSSLDGKIVFQEL